MNQQPRRLRSHADVLATVPEMVGYFPRNSLVILPFSNQHGRACIRFDLPEREFATAPEDFAAALIGYVLQLADTTEILIAVFTDKPITKQRIPFDKHARALADIAEFAGIHVRANLCRAANAWRSYSCEAGGDLTALDKKSAVSVPSSLAEFAALPEVDVAHRNELRRILREELPLRLEADQRESDEPALDSPEVLNAWENLLRAEPWFTGRLRVEAQAVVAMGMREGRILELLLLSAIYGPEAAAELDLVWESLDKDGEQQIDSLISDRVESEPIDRTRSAAAIGVLRDLVAPLPREDAANALAALAWLEWSRGSSSLAGHYAEEAHKHGSSLALVSLVMWLADNGIMPGWIGEAGVSGGFTEEDFDRLLKASE